MDSLRQVPVKVHGTPNSSQESVDFAMDVFGIDKPHYTKSPKFDQGLMDRGLIVGSSFGKNRTVSVGPAAFESWGLLASTLAHEIEVHANQSFLHIQLSDAVKNVKEYAFNWLNEKGSRFAIFFEPDLTGTTEAEREAYQHEMNSALRFGLSDHEVQSIFNVMERYYPIVQTEHGHGHSH